MCKTKSIFFIRPSHYSRPKCIISIEKNLMQHIIEDDLCMNIDFCLHTISVCVSCWNRLHRNYKIIIIQDLSAKSLHIIYIQEDWRYQSPTTRIYEYVIRAHGFSVKMPGIPIVIAISLGVFLHGGRQFIMAVKKKEWRKFSSRIHLIIFVLCETV